MVVAVRELDLQLDAREEGRRRMEHEAVRPGRQIVGEACPAVGVGLGGRDGGAVAEQLDRDPRRAARLPCRARASRASRSWRESCRLDTMGACDLALVRPDEGATSDDVLTADHEPVDAMRPGEDEPRDEVVRAAE